MTNPAPSPQVESFRELIAPLDPDVFLRDYYGKKPIHIPGPPEKFEQVFSWDALNRLLAMSSLWTEKSFELAINGRQIKPDEFCFRSVNREGEAAFKPDLHRVRALLREGATLALDFIDLLSPELAKVTQSLEAVTGAQVCASSFCSWKETRGYASHFDTQNVFACHLAGTKTWRIYKGRMTNAADLPGGHRASFPQSYHEKAKGEVLDEITLTPGDLLYIPHGLYHDALSASEACLHVSFGTIHLVAHDFLQTLMKDLPKDPVFRQHLPHLDNLSSHGPYLAQLAERLRQVMTQPVMAEQLRAYIRQDAFSRFSRFDLPTREDNPLYRICRRGQSLEPNDNGGVLRILGSDHPVEGDEMPALTWILSRDFFAVQDLEAAWEGKGQQETAALVARLSRWGVIEVLA